MKKKILLGLAAGLLCVGAVGAVAADWTLTASDTSYTANGGVFLTK